MIRKIKYWALLIGIIYFLIPVNSYAQQYSENEVKAAFLCNFSKFVEWPSGSFPTSTSPIIIGFLNDSTLAKITEKLASNMNIGGRKLQIIQYKNMEEAIHCNLLYISPSEKDQLPEILKKVSDLPVLTVSETIGFCQLKGMINFSKSKNRFGFEINVNSTKRAGIKISSKLLGLATIIE